MRDPFFASIEGSQARNPDRTQDIHQLRFLQLHRPQGHPADFGAGKGQSDRRPPRSRASRPGSGERPLQTEWRRRWRACMAARIVLHSSADTRRTLRSSGLCSQQRSIVHEGVIHTIAQEQPVGGAPGAVSPSRPRSRRSCSRACSGYIVATLIEGHYSRDGLVTELRALIAVARRHRACDGRRRQCAGGAGPAGCRARADRFGGRSRRGSISDGHAEARGGSPAVVYRGRRT